MNQILQGESHGSATELAPAMQPAHRPRVTLGHPRPRSTQVGWQDVHRSTPKHTGQYYALCLTGGILSSSIRWALTPLDAIKCNMQVNPHKYPTLGQGLLRVFQEQGIRGLYKGFVPTVLSYSTQTGTKYMLYEWNKDQLSRYFGEGQTRTNSYLASGIYLVSAAGAEAIADVLMCPWETLKVQMQTAKHPPRLGVAVLGLLQQPKSLAGSLGPLWSRQIIGTMANFFTFEHTVQAIYHYSGKSKEDLSLAGQLGVTVIAGYASGLVSTVVSHPADSLLSLKARYPHKTLQDLIQEVGWKRLATQGLAPRMAVTGSIIAFQWFAYDTFKTILGIGTTTARS